MIAALIYIRHITNNLHGNTPKIANFLVIFSFVSDLL